MTPANSPAEIPPPTFREALRFWFVLGFISFGGPAGQIAILHRELVERRRWLGEETFLHGLNFCMLLPGPEAQQLATYTGWRLHGARGGIAAGTLFVLPSAVLLFGLSWLYFAGGNLPWLAGIFHGLTAAVIAVVLQAVLRIGSKALRSPLLWAIAAAAFVLIFFGKVSFIWILLGAALAGAGAAAWRPGWVPPGKAHAPGSKAGGPVCTLQPSPKPSLARAARVVGLCGGLWWAPVAVSALMLGGGSVVTQMGLFFSKAALVTFGGAYAVLPYVAQQAVEAHGWLTHTQMMAGLALAETKPGPLIMVLQFVGFAGGWQQPGGLSPLVAATLGSAMTTWVTFLPCFLFVFLGAPHIEQLGKMPRISAALTAITAAVVGVILNLGVVFSLHALWPQGDGAIGGRFDLFVAVLAVAAFLAMNRFKLGLLPVIGACALAGLVHALV